MAPVSIFTASRLDFSTITLSVWSALFYFYFIYVFILHLHCFTFFLGDDWGTGSVVSVVLVTRRLWGQTLSSPVLGSPPASWPVKDDGISQMNTSIYKSSFLHFFDSFSPWILNSFDMTDLHSLFIKVMWPSDFLENACQKFLLNWTLVRTTVTLKIRPRHDSTWTC